MPTAVYLPRKFKRLIQGQRPNRNNQSSNTELLGPHPKKEASDMHTSKHFLAFFYTTYTKKVPFYTWSKIGRRFIPFAKQTLPSAPSTGSLSLVRFCCTYSKVSIKSFLFSWSPLRFLQIHLKSLPLLMLLSYILTLLYLITSSIPS